MVGPLQPGYRAALSSVGGNGNLKFLLYILFFFFFFAERDFEGIRRERADFVRVTYDRVQWRVVIAIGLLRIA